MSKNESLQRLITSKVGLDRRYQFVHWYVGEGPSKKPHVIDGPFDTQEEANKAAGNRNKMQLRLRYRVIERNPGEEYRLPSGDTVVHEHDQNGNPTDHRTY